MTVGRSALRWSRAACLVGAACSSGCGGQGPQLRSHLETADFSGVALVVHDGEVVLRDGFGMADRELGVANSPDLVYRIGSITKPITASAVLLAAERGQLDLVDPACDYVGSCPDEWSDVTVAHLLNHTSGIPDLFGMLPSAPVLATVDVIDSVVASLGPVALRNEAGASYTYRNFNYMLLGYVLERASGTDWNDFVTREVLVPAGAVKTRYDDVWAIVEGRAHGYGERDGNVVPIDYHDHAAYAAGGLHSTVDDLRGWHEALVAGRIVDDSLLALSMSPGDGHYGYGWQIVEAHGRELQNHTGGISGFSSHIAWYPDDRLLVVLLSNFEDTPVKALACDLARLVLEDESGTASASWLDAGTVERCRQRSLSG